MKATDVGRPTMQCIRNIPCVCVLQPQGRWDKADPEVY